MAIPQSFIDGLNQDIHLADLIGRHVQLEQKGNRYLGLCPFHNEKTPSFSVLPDKGFYHCFGCKASGNAIKFLMEHVGHDFYTAVETLAKELGREIPSDGKRQAKRDPRIDSALTKMQEIYDKTLFSKGSAKIISYLKERGIDKKTAIKFGLGFAPKDGGFKTAFGDSVDEELLVKAGLAKQDEKSKKIYPYFRNRITFPIHDRFGRLAGFSGRGIKDEMPKYLNSPQSQVFDKKRLVYGLDQAKQAIKEQKCVLVVEGYMDVIMLARHGINNAVATMGTAITEYQLRALLTSTNRCVFCLDGDEAGKKAAIKALHTSIPLLSYGKDIEFVLLPSGEDPDSYVQKHKKDGFNKLTSNTISMFEMLLRIPDGEVKENETSAQRTKRWHDIASLLERLDEKASLLKDDLYRELAEVSKLSEEQLRKSVRKAKTKPTNVGRVTKTRKMKDSKYYRLLCYLTAFPNLYKEGRRALQHCDESNRDINLIRKIIDALEKQKLQNQDPNVFSYLDSDSRYADLVKQLKTSLLDKFKNKDDAVKTMNQMYDSFEKKRNQLESRKKAESDLK